MSEISHPWHPYPEGTVFDIKNTPGVAEIIKYRQEEISRELAERSTEETNLTDEKGE